jgi:hypothetical protein
MNRLRTLAFATLFLWTPGQLLAGVFSRDWKTPGDGLLTYDDVNQREWLDLSVSRLDQFPVPRFENVGERGHSTFLVGHGGEELIPGLSAWR